MNLRLLDRKLADAFAAPRPAELYASQVLGKPILDAAGAPIARIRDLVVRFGSEPHPPISGLVARQGRRDFYLDYHQVTSLSADGARLTSFKVDLRPFERREGEALLRRDILDKQLIDIDGRRVVRANDLRLASSDDRYRLVGVDVSVQGLLRRLGPAALTGRLESRRLIDWEDLESFATDVPMVRLRASHDRVARLHPVEIARIVDSLSFRHGHEVLAALDDEVAADTVQELPPERAADYLSALDQERAADILDAMDPNDAADLLADLPPEHAEELLSLMEPEESEDVRELMAYDEDSAAGLMTTELAALPADLTAGEALLRLRSLEEAPAPLYHLYLVAPTPDGALVGVVALRDLVLAPLDTPLLTLSPSEFQTVQATARADEVAAQMAQYDLPDLPVVDEAGRLLGIVLIDDAIKLLRHDLGPRSSSRRFPQ